MNNPVFTSEKVCGQSPQTFFSCFFIDLRDLHYFSKIAVAMMLVLSYND